MDSNTAGELEALVRVLDGGIVLTHKWYYQLISFPTGLISLAI